MAIQFFRDQNCTQCSLHEGVLNRCIPMRPACEHPAPRHSKALLVVGQAPGFQEDQRDSNFVGPAGQILQRLFINPRLLNPELWDFSEVADVYLANVCRCYPPDDKEPNITQRKACAGYLEADVHQLATHYEEVFVLCCGTIASQQVMGRKVNRAVQHQNTKVTIGNDVVTAYCTFHPSNLQSRRNPSLVDSIRDHLLLLWDHLAGTRSWRVPKKRPVPPLALPPPGEVRDGVIALDIETYGAIEAMPVQKHFHPRKSIIYDKVAKDHLIQTICIGWRGLGKGDDLQSTIFLPSDDKSMRVFWKWMRAVVSKGWIVCGMNLKFDLLYLRHVYPWASCWDPDKFIIQDIAALNYLQNELRPERSLKALGRLFQITEYEHTLADGLHPNCWDPALWLYNAEDCFATLLLREELLEKIEEDYGPGTWKLTEDSLLWFSGTIWSSIFMSEAGVAMDISKLMALHERHERDLKRLLDCFLEKYERPAIGKGSGGTLDWAVEQARLRLGIPLGDKRLATTDKTGKLKADKEQRNFFLSELPAKCVERDVLVAIGEIKSHQKLLRSYLVPLLFGRGKDEADPSCKSIAGVVYPDWYPIPANIKDEAGDFGGTIQCRDTCRRPALQTSPKVIKECITTRFDPGYLYIIDLSQIELRMAGFLSNDPVFRAVYEACRDLHAETASHLFPEQVADGMTNLYRQAGKKTNFLMLFKGGAKKLQKSLLAEVGLELPLSTCEDLIRRFYTVYSKFGGWQDGLIQTAIDKGFIELPISGASRLFLGHEKVVRRTYINEICNLPIQGTAAKILKDAQRATIWEFRRRRMRSLSGLQIYDSLFAEGPIHELEITQRIVPPLVTNPPFLRKLFQVLGRDFPIYADEDVYVRRNGVLKHYSTRKGIC